MGHGDLCEQCGGDKYTCGHYNVHGGCYNPTGPEEAKGSGTGGDNPEVEAVDTKPAMSSYVEDIDAACKALATISTFEQEADMKMLDKSYAAAVKRIKENSISIIDKAIESICDYYDQ